MSIMRMMRAALLFAAGVLSGSLYGQNAVLADLNGFYPEEIRYAGFRLPADASVELNLSVLQPRRSNSDMLLSYAWILNSASREKVWEVFNTDPVDREGESLVFKAQIQLSAGTYEVYYSTYPAYDRWGDDELRFDGVISGLLNALFDHDFDHRYFAEDYEELYCRVTGAGTPLDAGQAAAYIQERKAAAIVSMTPERDDSYETRRITVRKPVRLRVYALGEARRDSEYDFGWITDIRSRERIWQFSYRRSEPAGGASKNRIVDREIELNPGSYELVYLTDDSHSYRDWNTAPPFDPEFWGITLWPVDPGAKDLVNIADDQDSGVWKNIVSFGKARDDAYFAEGFTLETPADLHILALGEGRDGEMFDYAWIVNADTRKKVWAMDYDDTEPAGGAEKNRMFDGLVSLEKGSYMVYYVTDGSHAYRSWNTGKPYDPKAWGVSVNAPVNLVDGGYVKPYREEEDPSVLARITRVGDHSRKREKFVLKTDQYIHIYALGEGDRDEMYDYAWIEDANSGKVVWEMTYRKTERAGGARKNRIFDDRILIPAGTYFVIYESDDSHAFGDWNDSPPYDRMNYGITITDAER